MISGLHADIFNQTRYMIIGVTMKLRMTRSKDCFVLMSADAESYTVDIVSAKLLIRKLKIAPGLSLAHENVMAKTNAKYPLTRLEVKVFHLPKGQKCFGSNDLSLHEVELSGNYRCQQIEINSFPGNPLFNSTGFLPRVISMRRN